MTERPRPGGSEPDPDASGAASGPSVRPRAWIASVARARRGDREAFASLYDEFASTVHGIAIAQLSPQESSDLVQDVFLRAWTGLGDLLEDERFPGWLASLTRNRARDLLRRDRPRREHAASADADADGAVDGALASLASPVPDPRVAFEASEESRLVLECLQRVHATYREALTLRLVEGLSGPEIADRLDMTPGSVRVHLHRGMKLLREDIEAQEEGGARRG